ncbi:L-arabinose isomerase [bacterium]|nr:L-arabinose isomerase [bacterium]
MEFKDKEIWFVTGSQHLYGPEAIQHVAEDSKKIAAHLDAAKQIPVPVRFKAVVTTPEEIKQTLVAANSTEACIGVIVWMHTFSPSKMWIAGLNALSKPLLHLHTQFNRDIPWDTIDMDFMNLNQSAHGDREFGFIVARMQIKRKVVVGHWQDEDVLHQVGIWARVATAWDDAQNLKIARFGDNMREVAVTEGNKVSAQIKFGYSVNGYGLGDLTAAVEGVQEGAVDALVEEYLATYAVGDDLKSGGALNAKLNESARIELGMRQFLEAGGFKAFTTTFENLAGLVQLPGLAVQRLMMDGYGFGAEGDWKTAALVRAMKVMAAGLDGGTSFMEDYTYHLEPGNEMVLGAHMLEVCPSIGDGSPSLEIHPLGIGGKDDPARLVFNVRQGAALNATVVDMGNRFRLLVNTVEVVEPKADMPKLPVARVTWKTDPDLKQAAKAWILAGGAHHTCFSQVVTVPFLADFAEMAGMEMLVIDKSLDLRSFQNALKWNDIYYRMNQ